MVWRWENIEVEIVNKFENLVGYVGFAKKYSFLYKHRELLLQYQIQQIWMPHKTLPENK